MIIVNGWKPLTIITKHSILDVAAVLDPPLDIFVLMDNCNLFKQLHVFCSVLFLGNKIFALWKFMMVLIFRVQLQLICTVFLLNNLWNL